MKTAFNPFLSPPPSECRPHHQPVLCWVLLITRGSHLDRVPLEAARTHEHPTPELGDFDSVRLPHRAARSFSKW